MYLAGLDLMHLILHREKELPCQRPNDHTGDGGVIQRRTLWPGQAQYELIHPIALFGDTPAKCVEQTRAAERTLYSPGDH